MGEVLIQRNPKGVVVRVSVAVHLVDVAERASRPWCGALRRQNGTRGRKGWEGPRRTVNAIRNERLIDILIQLQVRALHSNVSNGQAHAGGQLTVDGKVPVLRIHVIETGIDRRWTQARSCERGPRILNSDDT